jgi:predicted transcriptional regulator
MSYTGRQFNVASKRRQGGKVETNSDLVSRFEAVEVEEVVIAVVRCERNQEQQGSGNKG